MLEKLQRILSSVLISAGFDICSNKLKSWISGNPKTTITGNSYFSISGTTCVLQLLQGYDRQWVSRKATNARFDEIAKKLQCLLSERNDEPPQESPTTGGYSLQRKIR